MSFGVPGLSLAAGSSVQPTPASLTPPLAPNLPVKNPAPIALINGTQTFLTYNVPADGKQHLIAVTADLIVSSAETGGACQVAFTSGGQAFTTPLFTAGQGATTRASALISVDPGTSVLLNQSTALSAGGSTFQGWAYDLGSV